MKRDELEPKLLEQIPVFRNLNASERLELLEIAKHKNFEPGETIIEQGESSQNLWILLAGHCAVTRDSRHDGQVKLAEFEPFSLFGEMSFFSPAPHSASVVATTPVKLLCIARCDYDDLIRDGAQAGFKMAYNVVEHLSARLRRMDEWIAELWNHNEGATPEHPARLPEWKQFRDKVFTKWNL